MLLVFEALDSGKIALEDTVTSSKNASSKISLWTWAAMRVMDYVQTLGDVIDLDNVAIIGHSRLGKTALVTGGYDTRFKYVISNDSGCSGAALSRGKVGEDVDLSSTVSRTGSARIIGSTAKMSRICPLISISWWLQLRPGPCW